MEPADKKGEEDRPHRGGGQLVWVPIQSLQMLIFIPGMCIPGLSTSNPTGPL